MERLRPGQARADPQGELRLDINIHVATIVQVGGVWRLGHTPAGCGLLTLATQVSQQTW